MSTARWWIVFLCLAGGCASHSFYNLMPTPNLYLRGKGDPFDAVPPALQNTHADVLYLTDRQPTTRSARGQEYGYGRNRSLAFGSMTVHLAKGATWEKLVVLSREKNRDGPYPVSCSNITELGQFARTPMRGADRDGEFVPTTQAREQQEQAETQFRQTLSSLLGRTDRKEVYIFVHGYNCEFEWPAYVIGQLWHFMGRGGVPIAYSWPSGSPGLLRGYQYDRESSEYTIYHFKQFLRFLSTCPDVKKVNIICHSRGTDVVLSSLRELKLELGGPEQAREQLKLGQLVVAAADLDMDVISQRVTAERMAHVSDLVTFYVSRTDKALGISAWMFSSKRRLGRLRPEDVSPEDMRMIRHSDFLTLVDVQVTGSSIFSRHSYFIANPAASSDLILTVRDGRHCGAENGRPLRDEHNGFWILTDDYPKFSNPPAPTTKP